MFQTTVRQTRLKMSRATLLVAAVRRQIFVKRIFRRRLNRRRRFEFNLGQPVGKIKGPWFTIHGKQATPSINYSELTLYVPCLPYYPDDHVFLKKEEEKKKERRWKNHIIRTTYVFLFIRYTAREKKCSQGYTWYRFQRFVFNISNKKWNEFHLQFQCNWHE